MELGQERTSDTNAIEVRKLEVEEAKLRIEERKLAVQIRIERERAFWTALGTSVPLVVAILTILYGIYSLRESARNQFALKAAEIALSSSDPGEALGRARFLSALFAEELPSHVTDKIADIDPDKYGFGAVAGNAKDKLIQLLAEHPNQRAQILGDWKVLFPADKDWIDQVPVIASGRELDPRRKALNSGSRHGKTGS